MSSNWTADRLRALGLRTDLVTACDAVLGCGRTKAYELYRRGELPFDVIVSGSRIVVPVAPLLAMLGVESAAGGDADNAAASAQA